MSVTQAISFSKKIWSLKDANKYMDTYFHNSNYKKCETKKMHHYILKDNKEFKEFSEGWEYIERKKKPILITVGYQHPISQYKKAPNEKIEKSLPITCDDIVASSSGGLLDLIPDKQLTEAQRKEFDNQRDFQNNYPLYDSKYNEGDLINSDRAKKIEDDLISGRQNEATEIQEGTIYRDITSDEIVKEQDDAIKSGTLEQRQASISSGSSITDYFNQFGSDTLIGAMMRPRSEGGPGFPYASAPSTFAPEGASNGLTYIVGQGYRW